MYGCKRYFLCHLLPAFSIGITSMISGIMPPYILQGRINNTINSIGTHIARLLKRQGSRDNVGTAGRRGTCSEVFKEEDTLACAKGFWANKLLERA
jgi:hypothetical protein